MRLGGVVFLVIGAIVSVVSFILNARGGKMTLFLIAGIAMTVFGIFRIFIDKTVPEQKEYRPKHLHDQLPPIRHNHDIPRICSQCNTRNNPRANYCGHCGQRL